MCFFFLSVVYDLLLSSTSFILMLPFIHSSTIPSFFARFGVFPFISFSTPCILISTKLLLFRLLLAAFMRQNITMQRDTRRRYERCFCYCYYYHFSSKVAFKPHFSYENALMSATVVYEFVAPFQTTGFLWKCCVVVILLGFFIHIHEMLFFNTLLSNYDDESSFIFRI